jgi:XisI protein
MDQVERYRKILKEIVTEYASWGASRADIRNEAAVDEDRNHYEVVSVGWQGRHRVHGSVVHLDIIDGKVWIQHDGTNRPVADELLAAGIPREDIVLGFQPPDLRKYTDFAEA